MSFLSTSVRVASCWSCGRTCGSLWATVMPCCCGTLVVRSSSSSGWVSSSSLTTSSRELIVLDSCFDLVEVGVSGRGQTPSTLVDLPNTATRCTLRCRSWLAGSMMRGRPRGEGLGITSPHLGCHLRTLRSCSSSTSSSTSLSCRKRRSSWSRLFSRLQSFHSCSTFQVLDSLLCWSCCVRNVRVHSSSCGAHRDVHSPLDWLYHRCHCKCRDLVFVGRLR